MADERTEERRPRQEPLVAFAWLGIVVLLGYILAVGRDVLIPLALAVFVWQLVNALQRQIRRVRIGGQTAPRWLRLVLAIGLITGLLVFAGNLIVMSIADVTNAAPRYEENLQKALPQIIALVPGMDEVPTLRQLLGEIDLEAVVGTITGALTTLVGSAGLLFIYLAFILFEQETFDRKIDVLFPDGQRAADVRAMLTNIDRRIETYILMKTAVSGATAVLSWIVLRLVGVDYAEFWAVVVFLLNFIPTIGSIIGVALPTLLALVQFGELGPVLLVLIGLGAVQFTLGNAVEPRIMGSSLNLSPLVIIVSLAVWGSLWGFAGMFLAVPMMVMIMIVCAQFVPTRPVAILLSANGRVE
jgi:AI-2 transport protein TqsA